MLAEINLKGVNEQNLISLLKSYKFEILYSEKMSFKNNCSIFDCKIYNWFTWSWTN